jgi:hypothetical protein
MKECDNSKIHIRSNFILSISLTKVYTEKLRYRSNFISLSTAQT